MKRIKQFFKLISFASLLFCFVSNLKAQSNFSFQYLWLCDSTQTTFYKILLNRPGYTPIPYSLGAYYLPSGATYTPQGSITVGPCGGGADSVTVSFPDSSYQLLAFEMCDLGTSNPTSFIRVYKEKIKSSSVTRTIVGDFKATSGVNYTPTEDIIQGNCLASTIDTGQTINIINLRDDTLTITANSNRMGVDIWNVGTDTAFLIIYSDTVYLPPSPVIGEWFCNQQYDQALQKTYYCPKIYCDATGTQLSITQRSR